MNNEFQHTYGPDGWLMHKENLLSIKTTPSELMDYVSNPKYGMRIKETATYHVNATSDVLQKAFDSGEPKLESAAALHPKASNEILTKAMKGQNSMAARNALLNPKSTREHIELAHQLADGGHNIAIKAAITRHHLHDESDLERIITHDDPIIANTAASSSKATEKILDKALKHPHYSIRATALHNPNISNTQIRSALGDPENFVRNIAGDKLYARGIISTHERNQIK